MNLTPPLDPDVLEQAFTAYRLSRLLHAVASLEVAEQLRAGPLDAAALARRTGTHAPSLASAMDALSCWGVFARDGDGQYALTPFSRRLLPGEEGGASVPFLLGWVGHPAVYEGFGDVLYTLRTGRSAVEGRHGTSFQRWLAANPPLGALYQGAMDSTLDGFRRCAAAYDFGRARVVVDVGGGSGAFAREMLARWPRLRAISYDLPEVIEQARCAGPGEARLELVAGDAFVFVPTRGDVYVASTLLRCFCDDDAVRLLKSIRAAMRPDARFVAFEMVIPPARDDLAVGMADVTARVVYGGHDRTEAEFDALFARAGLLHTRTFPTGGPIHAIEAVALTLAPSANPRARRCHSGRSLRCGADRAR
jgi:SAM-dependent methyltransferase